MKINEVVTEAAPKPGSKIRWRPGFDQKTGRPTGVMGHLASDFFGPENYAMAADRAEQKRLNKEIQKHVHSVNDLKDQLPNTIKGDLPGMVDQLLGDPVASKLQQQFELIDNDPPTIEYKNNTFQRDEFGKWIDFRTGKEAPVRFAQMMDRVSPPPASTGSPTANQLPLMSPSKPKAPKPAGWQQPTTGPAVWKSNRPQQPTAPAPAATGKAHVKPTGDGGVQITDKVGQTYTRPAGKDYWTAPGGGIYMPGSPEYQKLNATAGKR